MNDQKPIKPHIQYEFPLLECRNDRCKQQFKYLFDHAVYLCPRCTAKGIQYPTKQEQQEARAKRKQKGLPLECSRCKWTFDTSDDLHPCVVCYYAGLKESFGTWTTKNQEIDEYIRKKQVQVLFAHRVIQFIDYSCFKNKEPLGEGGFATVFKADWIDGHIKNWNYEKGCWDCHSEWTVAIKVLKLESEKEFFNELFGHYESFLSVATVDVFGVSVDPETGNLILITNLANLGSLRQLIQEKFAEMDMKWKSDILFDLAYALNALHGKGLIHGDLHPANIMFTSNQIHVRLMDFGLCFQNSDKSNKEVRGVLPYVAPEVLIGKPMTRESEYYSFSMIAYEVLTGRLPYDEHDDPRFLAIQIINGLRPELPDYIPRDAKALFYQFWHADPKKRPNPLSITNLSHYFRNVPIPNPNVGNSKSNSTEIYTSKRLTPLTDEIFSKSLILDFANVEK